MKPPQHRRKRGQPTYLLDVIDRMREGTTTWNDGDWMLRYISDLRRQAGVHRKDNELMLRVLSKERQELWDLRDKLAAWDAWEHAWVFGGDAAYPGKAGVTDPRETLDALERLALGVPEEEADDGH